MSLSDLSLSGDQLVTLMLALLAIIPTVYATRRGTKSDVNVERDRFVEQLQNDNDQLREENRDLRLRITTLEDRLRQNGIRS